MSESTLHFSGTDYQANTAFEEFVRWRLWFPLCFVLIAAVSVYDVYLTIRFREHMVHIEENPFGRWLLVNCEGSVKLFLELKVYGTLLVLLTILLLHIRRSRISLPVTGSLASAQSVLLTYLTFA